MLVSLVTPRWRSELGASEITHLETDLQESLWGFHASVPVYRMRHSSRYCSLRPLPPAHLLHGLQMFRGDYFSVSSSLCDLLIVASSRFLLVKEVAAEKLPSWLAFLDSVLDPAKKNSEDRSVLRWRSQAGSQWTGLFGVIERQHLAHLIQGPPLMFSISSTVGYQDVVILIDLARFG